MHAPSTENALDADIAALRGVGERRAEVLRKAGLRTLRDLLHYYPRRYLDRSTVTPIRQLLEGGQAVTVVGTVRAAGLVPGKGGKRRLEVLVEDESGGRLKAVWFRGATWIAKLFQPGDRVALHGKAEQYGRQFSIAHPDFDKLDESANLDTGRIIALYSGGQALESVGFNSRAFRRVIYGLFKEYGLAIEEPLPEAVTARHDLIPHNVALRAVHFPKDAAELGRARRRLKFDELFGLQFVLAHTHQQRQAVAGPRFGPPGAYVRRLVQEVLPFELTEAQRGALRDIAGDLDSGRQMNRLVQGDVGSGKTVVAVAAMMHALDAGYQSAFLAPTEILAEQHYRNLERYFEPLGVGVRLLLGGQRKALREEILADLAEGRAAVAVGTHALIEDAVQFERLGLAVVDEQHRFGVMQRAKMFTKGARPHMLLMTATPIPRSLALTVYGDLDVSLMRGRPAGRKPIETRLYSEKRRDEALAFVKEQMRAGRQCYWVFPLVEESEAETLADIKDAESGAAELAEALRPYRVDLVHGRLLPYEKDEAMARFKGGETDLLVATTVIEVGVDVPNATVMTIEHAERFGLAQLHQLRGRVGRGADQSHCILLAGPKQSAEGRARLQAMLDTDDGFVISELDLQLRGAGDFFGTRQSGMPALKIADVVRDQDVLEEARAAAFSIAEADPQLRLPEHAALREHLGRTAPKRLGFARVG